MLYIRGIFGIFVFILIAWAFSLNRKSIDWRLVGIGVFLQVIIGTMIIIIPQVANLFQHLSELFVSLLDFSQVGAEFIFGDLARNSEAYPNTRHQLGLIIAFQVLPTIIFFAAITAGLYYLGILQRIVFAIAWVMARTMRLSGPESLSAAGNIFLGQTEAPLLVKPYISKMTYSELMALMTGGMATIAGGVLAAYVSFLGGDDPAQRATFAAHLLSASMMNAPAALVMAKIMVPQTEPDKIQNSLEIAGDTMGVNLIDALATGTIQGLKLAFNVGAMLLAFTALIAMINQILGFFGAWVGLNEFIQSSTGDTFQALSLEYVLGIIARPLAWLMGVSWDQTLLMGSLLGQKIAINEFIAYKDLARMNGEGLLTQQTVLIATYALCGFANFASIAIQIGGIGGIAPEQQSNLSRLGLRALLAGTLACMMTATLAGILSNL